MPFSGWKRLREPASCFRGDGGYPIPAYSEFMPPPLLGCKPYGAVDTALFADDDPFGWRVNEFEERLELRPGLELLGRQILRALIHLGRGDTAHGISRGKLTDNPFWRAGRLPTWTTPFLWEPGQSLRGVSFLLTFRPFAKLPSAVQKAYLAGELHLLPFPGSLFFWGVPAYLGLHGELPFAVQIPLLHTVSRHEDPR